MEVDNVAGNRNDLGSNGEEEPVPGGPVVAAHAGAMGEPDRAGRLLDDNFWEDNELQEGEPAGFLSSLNGSDDDTTDEEPAEEEDEEQEGEQRQQPEAATQEGGAEEVGNGTRDPDDDRELPECFSHELIGKPPKNSSIGGVLVDLLGVKADYELPTAAYEEILYILNTALGNDRFPKTEPASLKALGIDSDISRFERHWCRSCGQYVYPPPADIDMMSDPEHSFSTQEGRWRLHDSADELGVASCMECEAPRFVQVRKNRKIILEPDGIYFDFGIIEILWRMLRRPDSAANQPYRQDLSKNAFLNSDFGRQLKEATDGAIADAANLIMDVGIDGVQLTKFKHHSATVYVSRVANVPRYKLTGRGYHAAFFACMWCLFQGIHLDGAVRFLGYFAAAAQTLWHQAFNPILPPGNGVRDTRARQEGEAQKRCITEVLRDPGRQCVQSCFAGADGSMLTDTELEALQRASAAGKLPKGLTGSAHVHAAYDILGATFSIVNSHALPLHHALLLGVVKTFLLRMGEVQVRSRGPGSAMIKFKNFYRIYDQRVKNIKVTNDFGRPPIIIMGGSSMFPNWTAESFQDFILTYSHSAMDDLLKKLPKHWHTAFMCLTAVCRHYLKADAAVYAKPGETEASLLGRILETDNAIDNRRLDGAANLIRFAKICEHLCGDFRLMCSNLHVLVCRLAAQEKALGCTAREVEMFLERGVRYFRKVIVGKCSKDPERAFAVEVMKQMRLEDFELLYNDMVTSMRRDRGSMSTTAKKAHAALGAVGGAVSKARVQEEFCEEGVDVHAHTVALFKTYVEEFGPDGLKVQDIREDTTNIKMTYYGRMEALKPDHESYTVYCSRAYNRLPKGNAWVLTAQRWENWGAGLVPVDFYIRQTTEQRKDLAFMPTGSAEAENQDMFQEILQVEVSYFVVAERHRKDNALAVPPVVFAVGDAHRGSRVPSAPISTGLWEGPINTVFQQDFVFPPSIVHGRLVTYTWTEAINTAGRGRRQRAAADAAPRQMIRWCSYVKHSHAKDIAALDEDDGGVDAWQ
eukprot:jgi/Tetstr1/441606/TSEL_029834.t1